MTYQAETTEYEELKSEYNRLFSTNKELLDSMYYSSTVQQGMLPHERHLKRVFSEYFVIYRPKNLVSGDLYWVGQKDGWKFFAVGDCTGHGLSGALLSVLGLSFLNYIILGKECMALDKVLAELDRKWIETFQQGAGLGYSNDWLEIGLCAFDEKSRAFHFAGAISKLMLADGRSISTWAGNRYPIGGWQIETDRRFEVKRTFLPDNAMIYLFSDGYKDQFNAAGTKRFGSRRFGELLGCVQHLPVREQKMQIEHELAAWRGSEGQTDDICVMGVRL